MGIESAGFISELVITNPTGADDYATADDHLRLIKSVLQAQFPNFPATAMNATVIELNKLVGQTLDLRAGKAKVKPSRETINNSAALQDDDDLVLTGLVANKYYEISGMFLISNDNSAAGFRLEITTDAGLPSGSLFWTHYDPQGGSTTIHIGDASPSVGLFPVNGTAINIVKLKAVLRHATGVAYKLRWAQNVATVANTHMEAHSMLRAVQLD